MPKKKNKLKEIIKIAHQTQNKEYDENGCDVIRMQVRDDSSFLSMYSPKDQVIISDEVANYFDNMIKTKKLNHDLHIIISSNVIDDDEKIEYQRGIKNYYRIRIIDIQRRLKTNLFIAMMMIVTAVFIFSLYVLLEVLKVNYILLQLIDIAGWVFVWEAVDLLFLERKKLRIEQLRDCSMCDAKISYEKINESNSNIE